MGSVSGSGVESNISNASIQNFEQLKACVYIDVSIQSFKKSCAYIDGMKEIPRYDEPWMLIKMPALAFGVIIVGVLWKAIYSSPRMRVTTALSESQLIECEMSESSSSVPKATHSDYLMI